MGKTQKEREGTPEKRQSIRTAAYRAFRDHGFSQTSVDAICKRAAISKGSFYWHYSSKQEVFLDILDTWSREVAEEVVEQFQQPVLQGDKLLAIANALQREAHRGRSIVPLWLEFAVYSRDDRELQHNLARFFKRIRETIAVILRPAVGHRLEPHEIHAVASTIFGAYMGLILQEICDPVHVESERLMGAFLGVLAQGLSTEPLSDLPTPPNSSSEDLSSVETLSNERK